LNHRIGWLVVQNRLGYVDRWEAARLVDLEATSHTGQLAEERADSGNHLMCQSRIGDIETLEDQIMMGYTGSLAGWRRTDLVVRLAGQERKGSTVRLVGRERMSCVGYRVERSMTDSVDQGYSASHNCYVRTGILPACFARFGHIGSCQNMTEGYFQLNVDQVVGIAHSMARTGLHLAGLVACTLPVELCRSRC